MARKKDRERLKPAIRAISPFERNLKRFINNADALNKTLAVTLPVIENLHKADWEKLDRFLAKRTRGSGDEKRVSIKDMKSIKELRLLMKEESRTRIAANVLPKSLFVSIVSQFDLFILGLIKAVLGIQPNVLPAETSLTFAELREFKDVKDITDYLIEREVDSVSFSSQIAHVQWLEKRLKIDLQIHLEDLLPTFIELFERRNLIVHADGVVGDRYLKSCKEYAVVLDEKIKKGPGFLSKKNTSRTRQHAFTRSQRS